MGPEHLEGDKSYWSKKFMQHDRAYLESERPTSFETPHLRNNSFEFDEGPGWNFRDSERVTIELPQIRRQDVDNKYYSSYEERFKQTPREDSDRGIWSGVRGESNFIPNDKNIKDILDKYDSECITYKDAIPDFSKEAEATIKIENMTENRADNFRQCDEKCAEQWNKEKYNDIDNWTARDIKEWRQEHGYSWHERNDMKTCDLIPTEVNDYFGHLGGVSECRKRDVENGGIGFDE